MGIISVGVPIVHISSGTYKPFECKGASILENMFLYCVENH